MENRRYGGLSSSINPQELSLTVESIGKTIGALILLWASVKGVNPAEVNAWYEPLVAQATVVVSSSYGAYNAVLLFWGLLRKGIAFLYR